jgi:nucleoside-diphosphate-sugar epimerase
MADMIANISHKQVIFELPKKEEKAGYNLVTQSVLNAKKLEDLGWTARYDMKEGLTRTIGILRQIRGVAPEDTL